MNRVVKHLVWFGAIYIYLVLMVGTTMAWWHQSYAVSRAQAEQHQTEWTVADQRTKFWEGYWENDRSEWTQLFGQAVLLIGLASWVARRSEATQERIEMKVDRLLRTMDQNPNRVVPPDWRQD